MKFNIVYTNGVTDLPWIRGEVETNGLVEAIRQICMVERATQVVILPIFSRDSAPLMELAGKEDKLQNTVPENLFLGETLYRAWRDPQFAEVKWFVYTLKGFKGGGDMWCVMRVNVATQTVTARLGPVGTNREEERAYAVDVLEKGARISESMLNSMMAPALTYVVATWPGKYEFRNYE